MGSPNQEVNFCKPIIATKAWEYKRWGNDLLNGNGANEWECISLALAAEIHEMQFGKK